MKDYEPADIEMALTRMVSYSIGHLAHPSAKRYNNLSAVISYERHCCLYRTRSWRTTSQQTSQWR